MYIFEHSSRSPRIANNTGRQLTVDGNLIYKVGRGCPLLFPLPFPLPPPPHRKRCMEMHDHLYRALLDNFHGSITNEIEIASEKPSACVSRAAVMISYPRPKAVAVPADYHGNQAGTDRHLSGSSAWQGDEVVSRGAVTMSAMIMRPSPS